ncbi:unnamed protein product [Urochloa decumbens]|uniref:AIG1-type G domain-containing protein n=1 Tax=Urochloa decumbens TaxID=240449 RepID=A0ABC9F1B6_9POAL
MSGGGRATANSILGWNAFESEYSCSSVTETCRQMKRATFRDGPSGARTINVIDTPAATRFSDEDVNTVESIKMFFGDSISNHMILVFTNGDQVGESTLKKMLSNKRARYLQSCCCSCQQQQLKKLLEAVDSVISGTNGIPFSNQMLSQIKEVHERQKDVEGYTAEELSQSKKDIYDGYLRLITKMVEEKLNSTIEKLQNQLMEEQKARQKVETEVAEAKLKSEEEIRKLRESLEKAQQENDRARRFYEKFRWVDEKCTIM